MIVEDERLVARDIADSLIRMGYAVTGTVASAHECLESAKSQRPDLVLMDIHLEGEVDGVTAAQTLRDDFDIPVIFLSAYADDRTVSRAKLAAPLGYLLKPFRKSELRSAVELGLFKHQLERRLRERERWFATTLRAIGDAVIAVDVEGRVSFSNRAAEVLLGRSAASIEGQPLGSIVRLVNEKTREPVYDPTRLALERGSIVTLPPHTALICGDREVSIEDSAAPIVDERGQHIGAVIVLRDVSVARKAQEQFALADRLASLGAVAAGVAHEINNPLTYIVGNVGFLGEELARLRGLVRKGVSGESSELGNCIGQLEQLASEIEEGATRVARIVADLGRFGQQPTEIKSGNVRQALDWALRVSRTAVTEHATIRLEFEPVPEVRGDEGRLGQVFLNLVLNAAHAMRQGDPATHELCVGTHLEAARADGGPPLVVVTVRDTGTGMTEDVLERIFDPFFTTKPIGMGTGLGLSVCHGIVQELGGSIGVTSVLGEGSVFEVRLPVAASAAVEPPIARGVRRPRGRVLVVDDDSRVLAVLSRMLDAHDVSVAQGARAALAQLETSHAELDAVVCDVLMPEMSGIDLYHELARRYPALLGRVVFLSGGANTDIASEFLRSVDNPCLKKPPQRKELLAAVEHLLAATLET
ncbi:MAG TPA: response regulator [Polyangiaceae bacterium]|nr:response regulator [Polyangiaceae bacterium]